MSSDKQIVEIESKLAAYGKIPNECWIGENSVRDRVEWIIRRLKMTELTLVRYGEALKEIEKLSEIKEVRGELLDIGYPEHKVKEGGWIEIPALMKKGLDHAAKIANECLWKIG